MEKEEQKHGLEMDFETLVKVSNKFQKLKSECIVSVKLSLTGITNLVVNYEDQALVDSFLDNCYDRKKLYSESYNIDSVELQQGLPGRGNAIQYLDELIFGTFKKDTSGTDLGIEGQIETDPRTGKRLRNTDGFVNRKANIVGRPNDAVLIIRNLDYCMDFCNQVPGEIDPRSLYIFDNFRHPHIKRSSCLLLVTNEKLKLPFKIRTVNFEPVDEWEARHIIDSTVGLFVRHGVKVDLNNNQKNQITRKISGLTYTEASDAFGEVMSSSRVKSSRDTPNGKVIQEIDSVKVIKKLRQKINHNFMEDSVGLTHLSPKPWDDYICPESSNFTYDVQKIVRDFNEITELKEEQIKYVKTNSDDSIIVQNIDAIRSRMPHVILLYGKGGTGKSAFPLHFAGLLDFDVWDFNVTATHSKWVGEGPDRMRDGLSKISKASHLVVRIDEYDRAMGATSSSGHGMHQANKQVESEFMNWLQNTQEENLFKKQDIFMVLTTNHKENITGPLLRSGRIDLVIDIDDFDDKSIKETFLTAPRRMCNRGVMVVGFKDYDEFYKAVESLDLDLLSSIATKKGFTVRDIDMLLQEMSAHDYYSKKGKSNIKWNTETFAKVLEKSVGSIKSENTSELFLGDRYLIDNGKKI